MIKIGNEQRFKVVVSPALPGIKNQAIHFIRMKNGLFNKLKTP